MLDIRMYVVIKFFVIICNNHNSQYHYRFTPRNCKESPRNCVFYYNSYFILNKKRNNLNKAEYTFDMNLIARSL